MSASLEKECTELKQAYDSCFTTWFSEKFLKGIATESCPCEALLKAYSECVKVSLTLLLLLVNRKVVFKANNGIVINVHLMTIPSVITIKISLKCSPFHYVVLFLFSNCVTARHQQFHSLVHFYGRLVLLMFAIFMPVRI